jgi:hypothetical protein
MQLCECGCGRPTPISPYTRRSDGRLRGHPVRFIRGHAGGPTARSIESGWVEEDRGYKTACWIWQRGRTRDGYAHARHDGRVRRVHVITWEAQNGQVPDGLELDHLCRNPACVNPAHLEPVTHTENVRRGRVTKLSQADVFLVRHLAASTSLTRRAIADLVGVKSHGTVNFILAEAP